MPEFHPAFERARPQNRWSGPLVGLRPMLDAELEHSELRWAHRVLPHGACVAVRRAGGVATVRISRSEAPVDERARGRWAQELATFEKHLKLSGWTRVEETEAIGVAVTYTCDERLLCSCGAKRSENALLFADEERCDSCSLAAARKGATR